MVRASLSLLAFLTLVSTPLVAREMPDMRECLQDKDCALIEAACPGRFETVNVHHRETQLAENLKTRMRIKCAALNPPEVISGTTCIKNQCELVRPKFKEKMPVSENSASYCTADEECVAVENGGCSGDWSIVNKAHEAQYIKRAKDMNSAIECAQMPERKPKPDAVCVHNGCTFIESTR